MKTELMARPDRLLALVMVGVLLVALGPLPTIAEQVRDKDPLEFSMTGPTEVNPGEKITMQVDVSTQHHSLYGVQYTLEYNSSVINVEDVSKGAFLSNNGSSIVVVKEVDEKKGTVEYSETRTGTDEGVTGNGTLTTITLQITDDAVEQTAAFRFVSVKASDPDAKSLPTTTTNASLQIVTEKSPTPTATATPQPATESPTSTKTPTPSSTPTTTYSPTSTPSSTPIPTHSPTSTKTPTPSSTPPTTRSPTSTPPSNDWQSKLSEKVKTVLAKRDTIPVIIEVQAEEELDAIVETLQENGAANITRLKSIHSVSAITSRSALKATAKLEKVKRIQYDSRVTVVTSQAPPTITSKATPTTITQRTLSSSAPPTTNAISTRATTHSTNSSTATSIPTSILPTSRSQESRLTQTETTTPGFGIQTTLVTLMIVVILAIRRLEP